MKQVLNTEILILEKITNIKLSNLNHVTFNECIEFILKQNFFHNKFIKPDTLEIIKKNNPSFVFNFENSVIRVNNKDIKISYQIKCEYLIIESLRINLQENLRNHFFFKKHEKYGYITKNVNVEVYKSTFFNQNKYRADFEIELPNKYKIILEINEKAHENEGNKINDYNRALQIINSDKKIIRFFLIREKYIKNNNKNLKRFVTSILIPEIYKINSLHDERNYVINKLVQKTCENWRSICEFIYDSHLNPNDYIICLNNLNKFFEINWKEEYIKLINDLTEDEDQNFDDDDVLENEDEIQINLNSTEKKKKEDYYKYTEGEIMLTWEGFISYLLFIIKYIKDKNKLRMIKNFHFIIYTEFINILKEQRNNLLELSESQKIWGNDSDYSFIN